MFWKKCCIIYLVCITFCKAYRGREQVDKVGNLVDRKMYKLPQTDSVVSKFILHTYVYTSKIYIGRFEVTASIFDEEIVA